MQLDLKHLCQVALHAAQANLVLPNHDIPWIVDGTKETARWCRFWADQARLANAWLEKYASE